MALQTAKLSEVPRGSIILERDEAVDFQLDLMRSLTELRSRFFIERGPALSCIGTFSSAAAIFKFYRNSLNIGHLKLFHLPLVISMTPTILSFAVHKRYIRNDLVIQKWACPSCYQIRSMCNQIFFGFAWPLITSVVMSCAAARRFKVGNVPPLNRNEIINFVKETSRPFSKSLSIILLLQAVYGFALAHMETYETHSFNMNIEKHLSEYNKKLRLSEVNNDR